MTKGDGNTPRLRSEDLDTAGKMLVDRYPQIITDYVAIGMSAIGLPDAATVGHSQVAGYGEFDHRVVITDETAGKVAAQNDIMKAALGDRNYDSKLEQVPMADLARAVIAHVGAVATGPYPDWASAVRPVFSEGPIWTRFQQQRNAAISHATHHLLPPTVSQSTNLDTPA